jgi:predicted transcriptional regulator
MPGEGPLFWGFKRPRQVVDTALGSLERRMMELVWERGTLSVRDAHAELGDGFAYTTLMTTLDRLFKKGLLERRKKGRAYVYSAASTPDELERSVAQDLVRGLLESSTGEARPLLSTLVDAVGESDEMLLDELDRLVRAKRRKLRREGR